MYKTLNEMKKIKKIIIINGHQSHTHFILIITNEHIFFRYIVKRERMNWMGYENNNVQLNLYAFVKREFGLYVNFVNADDDRAKTRTKNKNI